MQREYIKIKPQHTKAAEKLAAIITPEIMVSPNRYTVAIAGESGAGKTAIAMELARILKKKKINNKLLHMDDYFRFPPEINYQKRRRDLYMVGTSEVKLRLLNKHIKTLKDTKIAKIEKPVTNYKKDRFDKETIKCKTSRVIIIEGTYAALLKDIDKKVFLAATYKHTLKGRLTRKREKIDRFDKKILQIEHMIISRHRGKTDIIIEKNFSVFDRSKKNKCVKRICMLSVHGYVDPNPVLGKTDTGGQVVYVLELAKALAKKGIKVDIFTRKFQNKKNISRTAKISA